MKKNNILLTICCVASVLSLILSTVTFITVNKKLKHNDSFREISSSIEEANDISESTEQGNNIEYETISLGNAQVSYPKKGTWGTEGDSNYIIIEDISISPSEVTSLGTETEYDFNFVGKYDGSLDFLVKQYDSEGFCIDESHIRIFGIENEHIKERSFVSIEDAATKVIIDIAEY